MTIVIALVKAIIFVRIPIIEFLNYGYKIISGKDLKSDKLVPILLAVFVFKVICNLSGHLIPNEVVVGLFNSVCAI